MFPCYFQQNAMNIDLGPTFISLAGREVPSYMDGKSLSPVWSGEGTARGDSFRTELLVEHYGEHGILATGCPQYNGQGMAVSTHCSFGCPQYHGYKYTLLVLFWLFSVHGQGLAVTVSTHFSFGCPQYHGYKHTLLFWLPSVP